MKNAIAKRFVYIRHAAAMVVGFALFFAVLGNNMDPQNSADVKPGIWGGQGITLVIEKNSSAIELDCAKGTISSRLRIGKGGRFAVTGFLTRSGPGPIRLDSPPVAQRVRFDGKITKKQMSMKITFVDTGEVMGDYVLERDKQGRLVRCF
jgi:hypothetical protein